MAKQMTLGVIVGNRGFFPSHLATSGRLEMIAALEAAGIKPIVLSPEVTAHGAVETYEDAKKCAELFKQHAAEIDGIIITLPNFGEERGLADALRLANLNVPVLRNVRFGAIGARPTAFNTVRDSEKLLERSGITVETLDLSEVMGRIEKSKDNDDAVQAKLTAIKKYIPIGDTPEAALMKMAKLGAVIDGWMAASELTVSAVQCWTSIEEYLGIVPCTVMSMMSEQLIPSACEVDVLGTLSMYALTLASETPSALLDWNNNYGDNPDKAVCFHCSNLPKHFFNEGVKMDFQQIIAGTVGKENTHGTLDGTVKAGAMSFARFSTDDFAGEITGYVGEGAFTNDPLHTFGGAGVVEIPKMQELLRFICENGFEHHVAANFSSTAAPVHEAATRYLGWKMHWHR